MKAKMIKFLIDVNLGIGSEKYLADRGFDILSVRSLNPSMSDKDIIDLAFKENRVLITLDKDFGDLVYRQKFNHAGILIIRLEDWSIENKIGSVNLIVPEGAHNDIWRKGLQ